MAECSAEECIKGTSERSPIIFEVQIGNVENTIINIWKWFKGRFRREIEEILLVIN